MKIEFLETTKKEVNLDLPHYRKTNCHFYAILGEGKNECVQVTTLGGWIGICQVNISNVFANDSVECTREEFEDAFENIYLKLDKLRQPVLNLPSAEEIIATVKSITDEYNSHEQSI